MSLRAAALTSSALLAACSAGAPPPAEPAAPPPSAVASAPASAASASAPPPSAAPAAAPPASPFHVVARAEGVRELWLTAPEHGLFVTSGSKVMAIRDGVIERDDQVASGLDIRFMRPLAAIEGSWPDAAYARVIDTNGRVGWDVIFHWEGAAWRPTTQLPATWMFAGISRMDHGRLVGLAVRSIGGNGPKAGYELRVLDGPHGLPLPKLAAPAKGCRNEWDVDAEISPRSFLALPSGHAFVAGMDCAGAMSVEWFAPGATTGTRVALAPDCWGDPILAGTRPDDVVVGFSCRRVKSVARDALASLFHFDGTTFTRIAYPGKTVTSLEPTPGGALWALDEAGAVRLRDAGGDFRDVPLPAGIPGAQSIHVAAEDDVWATAGGAVLRTRPPRGEAQRLEWPAENAQLARTSLRLPRAATRDCESIYVLLFAFSRVTPDDYDFPLTRKALAGHKELAGVRFVVTIDQGRKYLGAFAPTYDLGKKLVSVVEKGVKDAKPELLCVKPEEVRELKLDLATGDVVK